MPIQWISFDCYGTLIDWATGIRQALTMVTPSLTMKEIETFAQDYDRVEQEFESRAYQPYRAILQQVLAEVFVSHGKISPHPADILVRLLPTFQPFPEAARVLIALQQQGYRLAILSNVDRDLIQKSLKSLPVPIDLVVTAEEVNAYKPAPKHWESLLNQTRVSPARILHVAAGLHYDIPTAKQLGFYSCWVNRRRTVADSACILTL